MKNIELITMNKINCCKKGCETENDKLDALEQTILRLGEECDDKSSCILNWKQQNELLLRESRGMSEEVSI